MQILGLQPQISIVFFSITITIYSYSRSEQFWKQNTIDFFNNSSLNPRFPVKLYAFQIFAIFRTLHLEQIEMWTQRGTTAVKDALCSEGREKNILAFFITSCAHNWEFFPQVKTKSTFLFCTKIWKPEFWNPRKTECFQFSVNLFLSNC